MEWFHVGERERVERVLENLRRLGVTSLRTGVSWADWVADGGEEWFEWLLPRLSEEVEVLPCFAYTPPSLGEEPRTNAPPRVLKDYADWMDQVLTRVGQHFDWVELWNEPNNRAGWDSALDPDWTKFVEMVSAAAYWARQRGKKVLLGAMAPVDPSWLDLVMPRLGRHVDAVGITGFPGTWETNGEGWPVQVARVREVLERHGSRAEVWITQAGFSTWRRDEAGQMRAFLNLLQVDVPRVYWYGAEDLAEGKPTRTGQVDEREYHFGLTRADGRSKLLHQLWSSGGLQGVRDAKWLTEPAEFTSDERPVVITGGAGFVGTNLADRLLRMGRPVLILDNLSRAGTYQNLAWLRSVHGTKARARIMDIRNAQAVRDAVRNASAVFHLAAQVAVTTSLSDPRDDFEVNALGTFNVLEAVRLLPEPVPLIMTSTNKVYGAMEDVELRLDESRYAPVDEDIAAHGFSERRPLDFHSPYGCSKGAADQYVLDYARVYDLPNVVFRMSCIYGPHQHGTEDQGWVAHFLLQTLREQPVTIYGNGKQVRDVLFVEDLVDAFLAAEANAHRLAGRAFNIGGGPDNTLSLLELVNKLPELQGRKPRVEFDAWRPGDQPYYVSDVRAFEDATGWRPRVGVQEGLTRLQAWLTESRRAESTPQAIPAPKRRA